MSGAFAALILGVLAVGAEYVSEPSWVIVQDERVPPDVDGRSERDDLQDYEREDGNGEILDPQIDPERQESPEVDVPEEPSEVEMGEPSLFQEAQLSPLLSVSLFNI